MHHLPDEACLPDGCSILLLSRSLFAHTLLSAQERRRMLRGMGGGVDWGEGRELLIFPHHGKIYVQEAYPFNWFKPVREAHF